MKKTNAPCLVPLDRRHLGDPTLPNTGGQPHCPPIFLWLSTTNHNFLMTKYQVFVWELLIFVSLFA